MRKNTKFGINALIITLVTVAVVILLNAVITTIAGKTALKIDLTRNKVYEFSEHTKEVMKSLDKEITVYALYPPNTDTNDYITYAEEYLAKYEELNKNFKVTFIDPYTNPNFGKKYETQGQSIDVGAIILECGEKVEVVHMYQMYSANSLTGTESINMEKAITAAVMKVTGKAKTTKVYFTEGHGEYPAVELMYALFDSGYEVAGLNITANGIPQDAAMLVVAAPATDFTVEERDALDLYLDAGGKALFMFESGMPRPERLSSYLAEWGLVPNNDLVIETNSFMRKHNGQLVAMGTLVSHDITDNLIEQNLDYIMPTMGSIEMNELNIRRAQITPLITTSEKSWNKVDFTSLEKTEGDKNGPFVVAALSEMPNEDRSSIMVIGSLSAIEGEQILQESSYANSDFILNAIGYITEADNSMDIRAKQITAPRLYLNQTQVVIMVMMLQYILPLLIIIIGFIVWLKRRYK